MKRGATGGDVSDAIKSRGDSKTKALNKKLGVKHDTDKRNVRMRHKGTDISAGNKPK